MKLFYNIKLNNMKKISLFLFIIFLSQPIFSQGNRSLDSLSYIRLENYTSPTMNIRDINDFIKLINDNNVTTVFFNDELFLIQGTSTAYTISSNGYKNVNDYKNGNNKNFTDGESYYFAIENKLPNQKRLITIDKRGLSQIQIIKRRLA